MFVETVEIHGIRQRLSIMGSQSDQYHSNALEYFPWFIHLFGFIVGLNYRVPRTFDKSRSDGLLCLNWVNCLPKMKKRPGMYWALGLDLKLTYVLLRNFPLKFKESINDQSFYKEHDDWFMLSFMHLQWPVIGYLRKLSPTWENDVGVCMAYKSVGIS